jgi:DNA end-binding protein Ku
VLVLQTLLWADEVREAAFQSLDEPVKISSKELELSASLVDSFSSDFDPTAFTDDYQQELRTLIEAKLEQGDAFDTAETFGAKADTDGGEVIDLMEALRASVEKSRAARGASSSKDAQAAKSSDAKRTAKKPAKKASKAS